TQFMKNQLGIDLYGPGINFSLFTKTGVEIVYLYFQIPLMILVIAPAIDGLKREWREAASSLGASSFQFWRHVGGPILAPSLLSAVVLLFGNSFSAFATAYGLTDRRRGRPRPDRHRQLLQRRRSLQPAPGAGARVRHVRRPRRDDADLRPAAAGLLTVVAVRPRRFIAPTAVVWLLVGAAYFFIPL